MNMWLIKSKILSTFMLNVHGLGGIRLWPASNWLTCNRQFSFRGGITDLNLYGCGVAASKPLPTGTTLRVRITSKGRTFWALGKVAYATADGDMGIAFARIERNDQVIVEDWITELRDRS